MICTNLPETGASQLWLPAAIALVCLAVGVFFVVRRHGAASTAAVVLGVLLLGSALILPVQPALASTSGCTASGAAAAVTQTSIVQGLAPGIEPAPVTGEVTNTGAVGLYVTTVDVEIKSVTVRQDTGGGQCDATDYVLLEPSMPVNRTLEMGQSTAFAGASLGFSNKSSIQDACQNATVHLHYTAHTSGP